MDNQHDHISVEDTAAAAAAALTSRLLREHTDVLLRDTGETAPEIDKYCPPYNRLLSALRTGP